MSHTDKRIQIFEQLPIRTAMMKQILPAVASQMIALIYSLADTYFVGMLNDPAQTAAVTIVASSFLMLTAISNLFGIGGASLIAQSLGKRDPERAKRISCAAVYGGLLASLLFSGLFWLLAEPILTICGAGAETYDLAYGYAKWVVIFGGPATILSTLLANLIRAEGDAVTASSVVSLGGILNMVLDPFFVLPQFLGLGAVGAGVATALSNMASAVFFLLYLLRKREATVICLSPTALKGSWKELPHVLTIGFPSAVQYALTVVAVAAQSRFISQYGSAAVAALGIVKKLDQLPLYFSIGVSNGMLPLLAYNYAARNHTRQRQAFRFGVAISAGFSLLCLICYELFAPFLTGLFIQDPQTTAYASVFLRIMVTAMPLMSVCYPMIIQLQATGKVRPALICSVVRKGLLDIPLYVIMDSLLPLYGCALVPPMVDAISLVVALWFSRKEE